jgi:hypothetical protein
MTVEVTQNVFVNSHKRCLFITINPMKGLDPGTSVPGIPTLHWVIWVASTAHRGMSGYFFCFDYTLRFISSLAYVLSAMYPFL